MRCAIAMVAIGKGIEVAWLFSAPRAYSPAMPLSHVRSLVLLGAMALAGGGCSDKGGEAAASQAAGKVVEVTGAVKAARQGAEQRALAGGDPVYRDDTVTTGPDGSVTILLAHNQARWSLASGRSRRVDRSAAWRAEAGGASAFDDEQTLPTSSAGRHSEPQAGDTRATAPAPAAEAADVETRVAEAPARERPARKRSSRRSSERAKGGAAPGAAPDDGVKTRGYALGARPDTGAEGGAAEPAAPPMAVPSDRRVTMRGLVVSGARGKKELAAEMAARFGEAAQLCAQLAPKTGDVTVTFQIGRAGDVSSVRLSGPRGLVAEVGDCLREKAEELSFPRRREGSTTVRQKVRFEVP
jgi:hypothetical protein